MKVLNIAHRGASADAPENSLEAFGLAIEQGAAMIETDLRLSRDGEIPLFHDDEIDDVPVEQLTLAEIRQRIPYVATFDQALEHFGHRIPFNLEIKRGAKDSYPGLEERVLREITRRDLLGQSLFSSFFDNILVTLRELSAEARIGLLISRKAPVRIAERAAAVGAETVHPERLVATRELVEEMHGRGFGVHVFTVDDPEDQRRLIEWGVDGIFTNVPGQLARVLD